MIFVYSGDFLCEAEQDQFEQTRVIMGLHNDMLHYPLAQHEELIIPETILSFSAKGSKNCPKVFTDASAITFAEENIKTTLVRY